MADRQCSGSKQPKEVKYYCCSCGFESSIPWLAPTFLQAVTS